MRPGTSTPPSMAGTPVPSLPPPLTVNSYASLPALSNGQSATEALYTNGVHAYQGTAATALTAATQQSGLMLLCKYYSSTDSQASV